MIRLCCGSLKGLNADLWLDLLKLLGTGSGISCFTEQDKSSCLLADFLLRLDWARLCYRSPGSPPQIVALLAPCFVAGFYLRMRVPLLRRVSESGYGFL